MERKSKKAGRKSSSAKKSTQSIRSKPPRQARSKKKKKSQGAVLHARDAEHCAYCGTDLRGAERALFVEEEVGRIFCSEECITAFFAPEIEKLEKEYVRRMKPENDLTGEEREKLAHLRWVTLQEPDEVWREKTVQGDLRYTFISEFRPGSRRVWCICICLCLRQEPSFLYLAFPTADPKLVMAYRKGERVKEWKPNAESAVTEKTLPAADSDGAPAGPMMDSLADSWTADDALRAQLNQERAADDIAADQFGLYQACLEETLETPDEVWSMKLRSQPHKLFHFIRRYAEEDPAIWYIVIARETDDEEQLELLDSFPTRDPQLVDRYRQGEMEFGKADARPATPPGRVVH